MNQHITRAYNNFHLNKDKGIFIKTSKETRLKDEIEYYEKINAIDSLSIFFPRYLKNLSKNQIKATSEEYELALEYLAYNNLGNIMLFDDHDVFFWQNIISLLNIAFTDFRKYEINKDFENIAKDMYIEKTLRYYYDLKNNFSIFNNICSKAVIRINGKLYDNFESIWHKIQYLITQYIQSNKNNSLCVIHGDCCFSNILCGINPISNTPVIRFIDPRGSFGAPGIYGDPLYDIAKLRHSYEGGYEFIISDKFILNYDKESNDKFCFSFNNFLNKTSIQNLFQANSMYNLPEAKLIEGLIFIGMCSRHYDSIERQIVMYCTGIKILNEVIYENMY